MPRKERTELDKAIKRLQTDAWLGYIEQEYMRATRAVAGQYKFSDIADWIDASANKDYGSAETLRQLIEGRNNKVMPAERTLNRMDEVIKGSRHVFEHGPLGTLLFRVINLPIDSGELLKTGMGIAREPLNEFLQQQRLSDILACQVRGLPDNTLEDVLGKLTYWVAWWRYALATDHTIDDVVVGLKNCICMLAGCERKGIIGTTPVNLKLLKAVIELIYAYSPRAKGGPISL